MNKFTYENIQWYGNEDKVKEALELPYRYTVKENKMREVFFSALSEKSQPKYFIKATKSERSFRKVKSLFRNKSQQEFNSAKLLEEIKIPVVDYIAWGKKGQKSFLITKALSEYDEVSDFLKDHPEEEANFYNKVTDLLVKMVKEDLFHPDFHFGNLMIQQENEQLKLCLLDVYGIVKKKMNIKQCLFMFRVLLASINALESKERMTILKRLSDCTGLPLDTFFSLYLNEQKKANLSFLRKRIGKLFKSSSFIDIHIREDGDFYCYNKSPYDVGFFEQALINHKLAIKSQDRKQGWLKTDKKRRVSRYQTDKNSVIVKEFVSPGKLGRFAADARSWAGHFGTVQYSIPAVTYHAWLKTDDQKAYIFMQDLGDENYTKSLEIALNNLSDQNSLLRKLASFVANLHNLCIYHRDLKTDNFMVINQNLKLIDLDDITFGKKISLRRKIKNLQQVYGTLPKGTPNQVKLRLLAYYKQYTRISPETIRKMAAAIDLNEE